MQKNLVFKLLEKAMEKSWEEAIKKVLAESAAPLHYSEISERILSCGYFKTDGATPAATVNARMAASIKHDGEKSPFIRVGRGIFALKNPPLALAENSSQGLNKKKPKTSVERDAESSGSIIYAFGMYWDRKRIVWRNDPKIYGKQQASSKRVDFGKQKGIYILYDHHTVAYVGRAVERPLGKRLYEHTCDRLGGRWNRFSWFGLLDVSDDGGLKETSLNLNETSLASLVATFEALLIEALEPPQNRKRGDDFSAIEYIQDKDPESEKRELENIISVFRQNWEKQYANR
ncbi:MAG: hypothetical protein LBD68_08820 [Zoogloeaceae bacterium]|nr:hypothetical protein [Zoogloeaceae bacterium]